MYMYNESLPITRQNQNLILHSYLTKPLTSQVRRSYGTFTPFMFVKRTVQRPEVQYLTFYVVESINRQIVQQHFELRSCSISSSPISSSRIFFSEYSTDGFRFQQFFEVFGRREKIERSRCLTHTYIYIYLELCAVNE